MGFFDLNIPYLESSLYGNSNSTQKATRVKIVIKAMELGYTGIAYNRTIKGVMSDRDRCSIPLLTLSSVLKIAPSLSSSVAFRRDLLGVPRASPFRQYTRLTVCADTVAQCQVLNAGNPVLKTYDLIAVKPLNQSAFDHACEKAAVDIISINFAEKVPFRLKLPMIKAAIERGVCFEITYSDLIIDLQARRQMICNAKLLVDWTRGKNLILSSAAPSVNELRGPYDVANLSSLLGLSMERAKAAVSKNCRNLIANSLRKKNFHKDSIRVEVISSGEKFDSKEPWSMDWLKWDPISSGEGDLQLDEMAKSFTASSKVTKTVKAIDFASVIDSMPSHGFQVKEFLPGTQAVSWSSDSGKKTLSATQIVQVPIATNEVPKQPSKLDLLRETAQPSFNNAPSNHQSSGCENSQAIDLPSNLAGTVINTEDIGTCTTITEEELKNPDESDSFFAVIETERHEHSQNCISNCETDVLSKEIMNCQTLCRDVELDAASASNAGSTPLDAFDFHPCQNEESKTSKNSDPDLDAQNVMINKVTMEIDVKDEEDTPLALDNVSLQEIMTERELVDEIINDRVVSDQNSFQESYTEMKFKEGSSVANLETLKEMTMEEEQRDGMQLVEPGDDRIVAVQIPILESNNEMKPNNDSSVTNHETQEEVPMEEQRHGEQFRGPGDGDGVVAYQNLFLESKTREIRTKCDSSVANHETQEEVNMEEQVHGEVDLGTDYPVSVQCISGKIRAKPKMPRRTPLIPLKRLLSPITFKKKARKSKHRIKKV
ncbi:hypothetical protein Ddye_024966 [Dipteronia dyeriana]|uniref:Uncharacterized protein n=1 Tax=Dipteronia dyeriana TaxID=168575 RepID=A0AAD9WUN9_9ROSI|nr:hypothetical protein Ddye_024966 [Dipteronia dyeriana]